MEAVLRERGVCVTAPRSFFKVLANYTPKLYLLSNMAKTPEEQLAEWQAQLAEEHILPEFTVKPLWLRALIFFSRLAAAIALSFLIVAVFSVIINYSGIEELLEQHGGLVLTFVVAFIVLIAFIQWASTHSAEISQGFAMGIGFAIATLIVLLIACVLSLTYCGTQINQFVETAF